MLGVVVTVRAQISCRDIQRFRHRCITQDVNEHHRDDFRRAVHLLYHAVHLHSVPDIFVNPRLRLRQAIVAAAVTVISMESGGTSHEIDVDAAPCVVVILDVKALVV